MSQRTPSISPLPDRRRAREAKTVTLMIGLYCRSHHPAHEGLCDDCAALWRYAMHRLSKCVFEDRKPTCAKCPVHCYAKAPRTRIRAVMRYAGWRMLFSHPCLATAHLWDGLRRTPLLQETTYKRYKSTSSSKSS